MKIFFVVLLAAALAGSPLCAQTATSNLQTVFTASTASSLPKAGTSAIVNASVRSQVGTGDQILIAGFVISGTGGKPMLIRGDGPALTAMGVAGSLANPMIELHDLKINQIIATNRIWGSNTNSLAIASAGARLGGFPLNTGSNDSALLTTLPTGLYTANVSGMDGSTGVALVELYDGDQTTSAKLVNVSTRSQVGVGEKILVLGFVVAGQTPKSVLLRGIGPTLTSFGVTGALEDPKIDLYDGKGAIIASNDDWSGSPTISRVSAKLGASALPPTSKDASLLVTLPPGPYTAQVSGVGATTGIALAELYDVPANAQETRWTMINVSPGEEQADCHLIEFPDGRIAMIDIADAADAGGTALAYLQSHNITKIDLVVLSHFHRDHYGRLADVINAGIKIGRVAVNMPAPDDEFADAERPWGFIREDAEWTLQFLKEKGIPYFTPKIGEHMLDVPLLDGTSASLVAVCLYDGTNTPVGKTDTNDTSIIVRLSHGATRALFTGDLNAKLGAWLAGSNFDLAADLLKLPHHGTQGCAPSEFFTRVNPKVALVPSPKSHWFSLRSKIVRDYFADKHIPTYVNGIVGHVTVTMNSQGFVVQTPR